MTTPSQSNAEQILSVTSEEGVKDVCTGSISRLG